MLSLMGILASLEKKGLSSHGHVQGLQFPCARLVLQGFLSILVRVDDGFAFTLGFISEFISQVHKVNLLVNERFIYNHVMRERVLVGNIVIYG